VFNGTFQEYLDAQAAATAAKAAPAPQRPAVSSTPRPVNDRKRREILRLLEEDINRRETELHALGEEINASSARGDLKAVETLGMRFDELQAELTALHDEWLEKAE
jgi:hypothetical protein